MTTTVNAMAAVAADKPLEKQAIERRDLGPKDIRIDIKFAGICHSDIHTARNEWGGTSYPVVPGHEIAGVVAEVGDEVTLHKVGDRVGVGCFVDSCGECEYCKNGDQQYCVKGVVQTYNSKTYEGEFTHGGYSQQVVVTEKFALRIPEGIELDVAAPLLCAGITLYAPLRQWGAGPNKRVAIIGLGGLGHIGVKIAAAMGAEVTVLSQTDSKEADGKKFGAHHYYATKNNDQVFEDLKNSFDLIINTVSANLPLDKYLGLLDVDGAMVELGAPENSMEVSAFSLLTNRRSLAGSLVGGIELTQEMLDFCAEHHIGAEIETIAAEQVNEAYDRVVKSDVRYRFVIDTATLA